MSSDLDSSVFEKFKILIQNHCGMMITAVHSQQLEKYLSDETARTGKTISQLYDYITTSKDEMVKLVNAVVVNETYFFREEKQFQFLKDYITSNFAGREIVMWSAASSSGEEAYSLASLAIGCGANPIVYTTDIDTDALLQVKNGVYGSNSFRNDGKTFKPYLENFINETENSIGQKIYAIRPELKEKIICGRANLLDLNASTCAPKNGTVDIIFIRNVFIYFDKPTRDKILKALTDKLKNGGLLFFSISEIAGINPTDNKIPLLKKTKDSIYYFEKNNAEAFRQTAAGSMQESEKDKNARLKKYFDQLHAKETVKENGFIKAEQTKTVKDVTAPESLKKQSPEEIWSIISQLTERKSFKAASEILENWMPGINQLYLKYFSLGFVYEAQKEEEKALGYYEKASLSNPHFWPAYFKTAVLLKNKTEISCKRQRKSAFIKTATILEEEKIESQRYTYLMGSFDSSYFYQLCNDYLKKELS